MGLSVKFVFLQSVEPILLVSCNIRKLIVSSYVFTGKDILS